MRKSILFSAACVLTLTSCATIVAGGNLKITIDGDTKDPVTIITEKQTYPNVTLPYTVQVDRHKIDGQRVKIQSETKDYRDVVLQKKINSWTFGNILIGGLIGWSIDLITNCVAKPDKPNYIIEERSK